MSSIEEYRESAVQARKDYMEAKRKVEQARESSDANLEELIQEAAAKREVYDDLMSNWDEQLKQKFMNKTK